MGATVVTRELPVYHIDLDLPPQERWRVVCEDYAHLFHKLGQYVDDSAVEDFGATLGKSLLNVVSWTLSSTGKSGLTPELHQELEGISKYSGLSMAKLLLLNIGYDLLARCTSIVSQTTDGHPFHLRTLDWGEEGCILRELTFDAIFTRGGVDLFRATTQAGFVGIFTGMRYVDDQDGGYSVSLNYRQVTNSSGAVAWNAWGLLTQAWPLGPMLRHTLQHYPSYREALDFFTTARIVAPCYLIIAGLNRDEGALVTRDRDGEVQRKELGSSCGTLVQTNLDHWLDAVDPAWAGEDRLLLSSVERRNAAMELMDELLASWGSAPSHSEEEEGKGAIASVVIDGHGVEVAADPDRDSGAQSEAADDEARPTRVVDGEELARWMQVLTTPPVLNPATLYTTIMSASLSRRLNPASTGPSPIPDDDDDDEDEKDDRQKKEGDTTSRGVYLSVGVSVPHCS